MDNEQEQDPIDFIKNMLESKSNAKQTTYKNLVNAFSSLCADAQRIMGELNGKAHPIDQEVTLDFSIINPQEFHLKLAGDLLIFVMHTNIITFHDDHEILSHDYFKQNEVNRYFGQINVYNFMYDSLKYNRGNDQGYLIARLMINHENRFFIEGETQLTSLYESISAEPVTAADLQNIIKICLKIAIKNDLIAPPYPKVRSITLYQKNEHTIELGGGHKIGFRMSYQG